MKHALRHILLCVALVMTILPMVAQQGPMTQITGMVRDSVSRDGVAYASISLIGTSEGTLANAQGGFTINSRSKFTRLRVTAMGYRTKDVEIKPGQGSVVLIDLVVASVTMSMGMIMLPPTMISLPFKLMLFIVVDGWGLLVETLVQTYH